MSRCQSSWTRSKIETSGSQNCLYLYLLFCSSYTVYFSDPDIPTKIIQKPDTVFKGDKVTLECSVEGDRPSNITYVWLKNKHRLLDVHTSKWTIKQASVQLRKNISCFGTSGKRTSTPAKFSADIKARANFLTKPSPYTGVLKSSRFVSLTCRIECSPLCPILWITKDQVISTDALYNISRTEHPADFLLNDFESVESTLVHLSLGLYNLLKSLHL